MQDKEEQQYWPPYLDCPKPIQKTVVLDESMMYQKRNELAMLYLIDNQHAAAKSALMGVFDKEIDEAIKDAKSIH